MLRSDNDTTVQQNFTIRVKQLSDGRFEATSPNVQDVKVVANTQRMATAKLGDKLHEMHANGKL